MTLPTSRTRNTSTPVASGFGRAHAKAILLGEHVVLHGSPALAVPVPGLAVTAVATRFAVPGQTSFLLEGPHGTTPCRHDGLHQIAAALRAGDGGGRVEVVLRSEIPAGRGLGSSAAQARAVVLALADLLGRELDQREVFDLVQVAENVVHGRASGVDALTTGADGPLLFADGVGEPVSIEFDGAFVLADSGVVGKTKDAVSLVSDTFARRPGSRKQFVTTVSGLVHEALRCLGEGDAAGFGRAMSDCHRALHDLGVSTTVIDSMVDAATAAGALGAKISGGGLGGCLVALVELDDVVGVSRALCDAGAVRTWTVPVRRYARHVA